MKNILTVLLICVIMQVNFAQNGFTTYTTNISLGTYSKFQSAFLVDHLDNKWIGYKTTGATNIGLLKYNNSGWELFNYNSSPQLRSNNITALAKDNFGNIWIGTDSALYKFNGSVFSRYSISDGLPHLFIKSIETVGNLVLIGTDAGLSIFNGVNFTNYNYGNGKLPNDTISCIKAESSSIIWIASRNNLIKFVISGSLSNTSFVNYQIPSTQNYWTIKALFIDTQNKKWCSFGFSDEVYLYNDTIFNKLNKVYSFIGEIGYPYGIIDFVLGPNNGVVFRAGLAADNSTYNVTAGFIEITPNGEVFYYKSPYTSFGNFIESFNGSLYTTVFQSNIQVSLQSKVYYQFNKQYHTQPIGLLTSDNNKYLDINSVKARISNRSDMHWDIGGGGNASYEVPKGSGNNSNFATALWIGGLDDNNQLHIGAQTYRQSGVDFWPGPLDTINGMADTSTFRAYDKLWKVSYADINDFITNFNVGNVQNGTYTIPKNILTWPAHGSGNYSRNLAPFVDVNDDGNYNPIDGDYPKIKGDQALYFIYNDGFMNHQATGGEALGVEIHGMAYAYGCSEVLFNRAELGLTTFYEYKIINRSTNNYHNVFLNLWSDVDLGYYGDDYVGSNVHDNYGYCYNGDSLDSSYGYGLYMPAQGFAIMKGPRANENDGIDNNNNGIVDEIDEDCKLNKFTFFNNSLPGTPTQTTDPENAQQYYQYMTGYWKDGSPFTCGGNAYGGTVPTSWVYTADLSNADLSTDYYNTCGDGWKETGSPGDRRLLLGCGPFNLAPGEVQEIEYALVTSFDSTQAGNNIAPVAKLKTDVQKVRDFYNLTNKPNCLLNITTGVKEDFKSTDFNVYPNPSKSIVNVVAYINDNSKINYVLVDVLGKQVMQNEVLSSQFSINVSDLTPDVYFLRLQVNDSVVVKKIVKE